MTKISNVYDDILTELDVIFPNKLRIPNAYSLPDNPAQFLRDSYGLRIDAAAPTQRDFCTFSRFRNFTIILTREVITTEIATGPVDTAVKAMLDDLYTLQKNMLGDDQFGSSANIDIANVGAFTGIEYFNFEKHNFITSEIAFSIQVSDNY
jgi:hypothetical protein